MHNIFFYVRFCPSNPNLIAGGCVNGQIVLWNIQEYQDLLQINRHVEAKTVAASMVINFKIYYC